MAIWLTTLLVRGNGDLSREGYGTATGSQSRRSGCGLGSSGLRGSVFCRRTPVDGVGLFPTWMWENTQPKTGIIGLGRHRRACDSH